MSATSLRPRLATPEDVPALRVLMDRAIGELQAPFLSPQQIESSRAIMGLDSQLIEDGTYFVIEIEGVIAGCGGWSRRATLYGSNATPGRSPSLLDAARDPARIRAMYTDPGYARRGVGRQIIALCEDAARAEGFSSAQLMATLAGRPLYESVGYEVIEEVIDASGGAGVPLLRMRKAI